MERRSPARQRRLLFISPVQPALTGNGLAMRAAMTLGALAQHHQVCLLIIPLYASPVARLHQDLAALCQRVEVLEPGAALERPGRPRWRRLLGRWARAGRSPAPFEGDAPFDVVHLFRLAVLPYASSWLNPPGRRPARHLDLDDVESVSRQRLAALYRQNGLLAEAARELDLARRCSELERWALQHLDRVYVCSEQDRLRLVEGAAARVCVLPNTLPTPPPLPPRTGDAAFNFLFVGTLGYYPNEDAVLHFATQILPLIRQLAPRPPRLSVVGMGAGPSLDRLASLPGTRLVGAVPNIACSYRQADALVVPLRAAGGTRIKILEAFSYRRPVVSTSLGAEGLAAGHGEHLLIADDPESFARACLRLIREPDLVAGLTERAYALFRSRYSTAAAASAIAACGAE